MLQSRTIKRMKSIPPEPADDSLLLRRQEWLQLGCLVGSAYTLTLPWSGYYMLAVGPTLMRKFPTDAEHEHNYGVPLLFEGDPCAAGTPVLPADSAWPHEQQLYIMLHYATDSLRPLGPWVVDAGSKPHLHYCSAFVWPERLYRILEGFSSRGIGCAMPVTASTFTECPYTAEGAFHLIPPPLPQEAVAVDADLHTVLLGSGVEQVVLPLLLDDSHTLDPACEIIHYCATEQHAEFNLCLHHNFLLLSDAVVAALLAVDPDLVFFPIVMAHGPALRRLRAQKIRIPTLTAYEEVAPPYDAIAEWRRSHLPPDDSQPAVAENSLLRDKLYHSLCRACQSLAPKAR